jgi:hypothetical protein
MADIKNPRPTVPSGSKGGPKVPPTMPKPFVDNPKVGGGTSRPVSPTTPTPKGGQHS